MNKILLLVSVILMVFSLSAKEIVLSSDNTLILSDSFSKSSISKLIEEAASLDSSLKSGYPIYLFLNTPGGSINSGLELYDFLLGLNRPVHTITMFAASMGFQTVQHLGKRYIMRYGILMSHKARGGFRGEFGGGMSQLDSRYGMWLRRIDMLDKVTVKRTNGKQTLKSYRSSYSNELWLNGQEAVDGGYADEVVTVKCGVSLKGLFKKSFDNGYYKIVATLSRCPLNTSPISMSANIITNKGEISLDEFILKNGKFGKKCRVKKEYTKKDYYTGTIIPAKNIELCASDTSLTLDIIKKEMKKKEGFIGRDLKNHIELSY